MHCINCSRAIVSANGPSSLFYAGRNCGVTPSFHSKCPAARNRLAIRRAASQNAKIALSHRENWPAQALGTHTLELERHGVIVSHETEKLGPGDRQTPQVAARGDGGTRAAVLHQSDFAEELARP